MIIKKLDDRRSITSTGYLIQDKTGSGNSKKPGTIWRPTAVNNSGYHKIMVKGRDVMFHRVVWEVFNGKIPERMHIDHINGCKTDNRLENLRIVTISENNRAYRKATKGASKYRGVVFIKNTNKWNAKIKQNGKHLHVGNYNTEVQAAFARDLKAIELGWPLEGLNFFGKST